MHVVVHGDDFTTLGTPTCLDLYEEGMEKSVECKLKGRLGHGKDDLKKIRVLNRIVHVVDSCLRYEADPRHAELLAKSLKLDFSKHMVTPGVKLPFDESAATDDTTNDDEADDNMVATIMERKRLVKFNDAIEVHDVPYKIDINGKHPRHFGFNAQGHKVRRVRGDKEEQVEAHNSSKLIQSELEASNTSAHSA